MRLEERYRPKELRRIFGQDRVVNILKNMIDKKDIPHILLLGPPGCGKTSCAWAFGKEREIPVRELNASDERGIDMVRNEVKHLAFSAGERIILLDEFDNVTFDAQHALRRVMERTKSTHFILTGNHEYKIIDPIRSRCSIYNMNKLDDKSLIKIMFRVLEGEGWPRKKIKKNLKGLKYLAKRVDGDARTAIHYLEELMTQGTNIVAEEVEKLIPKNKSLDLLQAAYKNRWEEVVENIGDINDLEVEEIYDAISELDFPFEIKMKMYEKLSDIEGRLRKGCSPVIQFTGFLSLVYLARHSPEATEVNQ